MPSRLCASVVNAFSAFSDSYANAAVSDPGSRDHGADSGR